MNLVHSHKGVEIKNLSKILRSKYVFSDMSKDDIPMFT